MGRQPCASSSRLRTKPLLPPPPPVFAWKGETEAEYEWCIEQNILKNGQPWDATMILDGGDLTETLHKKYPQMLERIHGVTEETTTGVHRPLDMLTKDELKIPAIKVNDPVNNKYGCRHSLSDAIKRGTDHLLSSSARGSWLCRGLKPPLTALAVTVDRYGQTMAISTHQ